MYFGGTYDFVCERLLLRSERLLHVFVYERVVTQEQPEPETQRLAARKAEIEQTLTGLGEEERFAEYVVAYGLTRLANASAEWTTASGEEKMRLQQMFFPAGVRYDAGDFETAETAPFFGVKLEEGGTSTCLASPTRIAPFTARGRVRPAA